MGTGRSLIGRDFAYLQANRVATVAIRSVPTTISGTRSKLGVITSIDEQEVAGLKLELFVISFEQDKLTLRVPTAKIKSVGMRHLAEEDMVNQALTTVTGRARVKMVQIIGGKRRRAGQQHYERESNYRTSDGVA